MDAQAQLIAVIAALWAAMGAVVTAYYRDLKGRITTLETQLTAANEAQKASNDVNAQLAALVPGLVAEKDALARKVAERLAS